MFIVFDKCDYQRPCSCYCYMGKSFQLPCSSLCVPVIRSKLWQQSITYWGPDRHDATACQHKHHNMQFAKFLELNLKEGRMEMCNFVMLQRGFRNFNNTFSFRYSFLLTDIFLTLYW